MTRRTITVIAIIAVAAGALALAITCLPLMAWLTAMVDWVRHAGTLGLAVYLAVFTVISLSLIPTSPLYLAAGVLYGALWGTVVMVVFSIVAALATFGLSRTVLRGWVARRAARDSRFAAIDNAIGAHAFTITWLLRFSPIIPFGALNYLLSATKLTLRTYVVTMVLGTLPGTIVLAYAGSLVERVGDAHVDSASTGNQILLWLGLVATVVVSVLLGVIGKRALDRRLIVPKQ